MNALLEPRKRFSRGEIQRRLADKIGKKQPVLVADAGIGLTAKMAEAEGIDLITATSEARLRMMGQPSCMSYLAVGNANDLAFDALKRAARMARHTPVICGIAPGDPYREISDLVKEAKEKGADGVITLPAAGGFGRRLNQDVKGSILHSDADLYLIAYCNQIGMFSIAAAFHPDEAKMAAEAGADMVIAHGGFTAGGICGAPEASAKSLEEICDFTAQVTEAVHSVNPEAIVLCHGGGLNTPEKVQLCLEKSKVQGMFGGSVFDRLPMERAITNVVLQLETLRLRNGNQEADL